MTESDAHLLKKRSKPLNHQRTGHDRPRLASWTSRWLSCLVKVTGIVRGDWSEDHVVNLWQGVLEAVSGLVGDLLGANYIKSCIHQ